MSRIPCFHHWNKFGLNPNSTPSIVQPSEATFNPNGNKDRDRRDLPKRPLPVCVVVPRIPSHLPLETAQSENGPQLADRDDGHRDEQRDHWYPTELSAGFGKFNKDPLHEARVLVMPLHCEPDDLGQCH